MLTFDQLQVAIAAAKRQFDPIRKRYPRLTAHLVFSSPSGQTRIDSSPTEILNEFPAMIVDDEPKTDALDLLSRLKRLKEQANDLRYATRTLSRSTSHLKMPKSKASPIASKIALTERNLKLAEQIIKEIRELLDQLAVHLKYDENCQIAMVFTNLNDDLLRKLRKDGLIKRTPLLKDKDAVRVILGTIAQFERTHHEL